MQKTIFMDKYPVQSFKILKTQTLYKTVDEIINYLKAFIDKNPVCIYITIFDHYKHTQSLEESSIAPEIKDAKNLLFCFGKQLNDPKILAVRPRSIGVTEMEDFFSIDFIDAPNEQLNSTMIEWVNSIQS